MIIFQIIGAIIILLLIVPAAMLVVMGMTVPLVNIVLWFMYGETLPINLFFSDDYDTRLAKLKAKMRSSNIT